MLTPGSIKEGSPARPRVALIEKSELMGKSEKLGWAAPRWDDKGGHGGRFGEPCLCGSVARYWAWNSYWSARPAAGQRSWTQSKGGLAQAGSHWAALNPSLDITTRRLLRVMATLHSRHPNLIQISLANSNPGKEIQETVAPSLTTLAQNNLAQLAMGNCFWAKRVAWRRQRESRQSSQKAPWRSNGTHRGSRKYMT